MAFTVPGSHISKGPFCYYLDELSKRNDSVKKLTELRKAIGGLKKRGFQGLAGVFEKCVFNYFSELTPSQKKAIKTYLNNKWFTDNDGWWPHLQPIEPTLCVGLLKAIDKSLAHAIDKKRALPIDSYWIIIGDAFETAIARSDTHVNAFIMTPPPPQRGAIGVWSATKTPLWVVKSEDLGGEVEGRVDWQRNATKRRRGSRGGTITVRVKRPGKDG